MDDKTSSKYQHLTNSTPELSFCYVFFTLLVDTYQPIFSAPTNSASTGLNITSPLQQVALLDACRRNNFVRKTTKSHDQETKLYNRVRLETRKVEKTKAALPHWAPVQYLQTIKDLASGLGLQEPDLSTPLPSLSRRLQAGPPTPCGNPQALLGFVVDRVPTDNNNTYMIPWDLNWVSFSETNSLVWRSEVDGNQDTYNQQVTSTSSARVFLLCSDETLDIGLSIKRSGHSLLAAQMDLERRLKANAMVDSLLEIPSLVVARRNRGFINYSPADLGLRDYYTDDEEGLKEDIVQGDVKDDFGSFHWDGEKEVLMLPLDNSHSHLLKPSVISGYFNSEYSEDGAPEDVRSD